jgi:hypothetical protein
MGRSQEFLMGFLDQNWPKKECGYAMQCYFPSLRGVTLDDLFLTVDRGLK